MDLLNEDKYHESWKKYTIETYSVDGQELRKCCRPDPSKFGPLFNFPIFLQIEQGPWIISTTQRRGISTVTGLFT